MFRFRTRSIFFLTVVHLISSFYFDWKFLSVDDKSQGTSDESNDKATFTIQNLLKEHSLTIRPNEFEEVQRRCHSLEVDSKPLFNKTIIFVIDALRAEFVPTILDRRKPPRMKYLEKVLQTNGIGLVSISPVPSVTLPGIKALVSGTLPSFANYILNLKPSNIRGDNIIEQLWKLGKRIVCFGDDVWYQMFPRQVFSHINKTDSLFVSDYTQVDLNVTWNVQKQLEQLQDWDLMILHYLGVDHIGHGYGYRSDKLVNKFIEMDQVFEQIFDTVSRSLEESYLIVVLGDHGMNEQGHHGGSSRPETHAAMMFISTKSTDYIPDGEQSQKNIIMSHIDFASTFQSLLKLDLLPGNQGKLVSDVLERFGTPQNEHLCILLKNSMNLYQLSVSRQIDIKLEVKKMFVKTLELHYNVGINLSNTEKHFPQILKSYGQLNEALQNNLIANIGRDFFIPGQVVSIVLCYTILIVMYIIEMRPLQILSPIKLILWLNESTPISHLKSLGHLKFLHSNIGISIICFPIINNMILMGSINYIRHEHLWWQYNSMSILFILLASSLWHLCAPNRRSNISANFKVIMALLICLVFLKLSLAWKWIQLDEKDIQMSDIHTWLVDRPQAMSWTYLTCLIINASIIAKYHCHRAWHRYFVIFTTIGTYLYRSQIGSIESNSLIQTLFHNWSSNFYAQLNYFIIVLVISISIMNRTCQKVFKWKMPLKVVDQKEGSMLLIVFLAWVTMSTILIEPSMFPMFTMNIIVERMIHFILKPPTDSNWSRGTSKQSGSCDHRKLLVRFVIYTIFAKSGFFQMGNTNSLSTIGVTACFVGLNGYILPVCTLFMLINVYSTYVLWYLSYFLWSINHLKAIGNSQLPYIHLHGSVWNSLKTPAMNWLIIVRLSIFTQSIFCSFILREHIFLWSVVSPKLLYETVLTIVTISLVVLIYFANRLDVTR